MYCKTIFFWLLMLLETLGEKGFYRKKCDFEIFEFKKLDHYISCSKAATAPMFCYFNRL